MFSPTDNEQPRKAPAPSIWSFDSGYGSTLDEPDATHIDTTASPTEQCEHRGLNLAAYSNDDLDLSNHWNSNLGSPSNPYAQFLFREQVNPKYLDTEPFSIDPVVSQLSVFTTKDLPDPDASSFLPSLPTDKEPCLTCEFWRSINPGSNARCEDCEHHRIEEPCSTVSAVPRMEASQLKASGGKGPCNGDRSRCTACELSALISPNSRSVCSTCNPAKGFTSPASPTPTSHFTVKRSRAGKKLPQAALERLQAWLDANQDNPYPSADMKRQLAQECHITEKQVTTWFTNARARQLNPLDAYLSSTSEDEGARESDIAEASLTAAYANDTAYATDNKQPRRRAGSVSAASVLSQSCRDRQQPSRRGKKKNYRRGNAPPQITEQTSPPQHSSSDAVQQETWQCTFCYRHLVPKSWRRHEETQHRPKAHWVCMPSGPQVMFPNRAGICCAFCMEKDPSEEHFAQYHRVPACMRRPIGERTFYRPDHLRQHVKNYHGATLFDVVQSRWKRKAEDGNEGWVCGFCGEGLRTWDARETHIANHFKEGATMEQWKLPEPEPEAVSQPVPERREERPRSSGMRAMLGRTFSRSSRTRTTEAAPQPMTSYDTFPTTSVGYTYANVAPVLPDINVDPFMTYGDIPVDDWTQTIDTQFPVTTTSDFDGTMVTEAPTDADFATALNSMLEFGHQPFGDQHPTWGQQ